MAYRFFKLQLTLLAVLALAACGVNPARTTTSVRELDQQGQLASNQRVAQLQQQLPQAQAAERATINLQIADNLIQLKRYREAGSYLQNINMAELKFRQRLIYLVDRAEYLLAQGNGKRALTSVPVDKHEYDADMRLRILDLQARVYEALGYPQEAIAPRLKLTRLLTTAAVQQRNAEVLLQHLQQLPSAKLKQLGAATDYDSKSWARLADLSVRYQNSYLQLQTALGNWLLQYPDNSAPQHLIAQLQTPPKHQLAAQYPQRIALVLPSTGAYQGIANKVKQGFMDAYLNYSGIDRPELKYYSSSDMPLQALLAKLQSDGVQMIIGPLTKDNVANLLALKVGVPVLTLNRVDNAQNTATGSDFYQFGLIPEDEAEQAAAYALANGWSNVAVIAPANQQGERIANAFVDSLQAHGGYSLGVYSFAPDSRDFAEVVRAALGLDRSQINAANSRRSGRAGANFKNYIREDLQAIYIVASGKQGRGIVPQLRFYDATAIPVLAYSAIYDGREQQRANSDLNRVQFTQPSWLQSPSQYAARGEIAPLGDAGVARYKALGADAFALIPHLGAMRSDPDYQLRGSTGILRVDSNGVIHRELPWAVFDKGVVRAVAPNDVAE